MVYNLYVSTYVYCTYICMYTQLSSKNIYLAVYSGDRKLKYMYTSWQEVPTEMLSTFMHGSSRESATGVLAKHLQEC